MPNVDDFPPSNKDKVLDLQGKRLIQLCKTTNVLICNGRLNQDKNGNYTYINVNGESVVDYCLSNPDDFKYFLHFEVCPPTDLSDHCALNICLQTNRSTTESHDKTPTNERYLAWDETMADTYRSQLLDSIDTLRYLSSNLKHDNIDDSVIQFTQYMQEKAFNVFGLPVLKVTCQNTVNQIHLTLDQGSCGLIKSALTHEKNLTLHETNTYAVKPLKTSNYSYTKQSYT